MSSTDEPDKYNRPFSPSERRILKAMASNRDDYNRLLNKESKEVKYLKNATGVASETPSSGESLASRKLASDAQNHYYDNLKFPEFVTPSNELEEIEKAMTCDKGCGHTVDYETCFKHQVEKILAWSDQRCIEARLKELLNIPFNDGRFSDEWIKEHWAARIAKLEATLTPNDQKEQ